MFNDGAFDALRDKKQGAVNRIPLEHGEPIRFGVEGENGVVRGPDGDLRIAPWPTSARTRWSSTTPTATTRRCAFALVAAVRRSPDGPTPIGIFRDVERPVSGRELDARARTRRGPANADLDALLHAGDTWTVS